MGETTPLYHYTDTARLPWIIRSGELRPVHDRFNVTLGYPKTEFVWATPDERDEASASILRGDFYRSGRVRHIRFTLPRSAFFPWPEVRSRYPEWTAEQVARLNRCGIGISRGRANPANWWCHDGPPPLNETLAVDWRSWSSNQWKPLPPVELVTEHLPRLGVRIGDLLFLSQQGRGPQGQQAYEVKLIDMSWEAAR